MRNNSGFTIQELMTVIAIIAIMASIAVPNLIGWLPNYRMRSGADQMLSAMWLSQRRAVRENESVSVEFDFGNERYRVFFDNGPPPQTCNGLLDGGEILIRDWTPLPQTVDLQDAGLGGTVCFNRRGFPNSSGDIRVANGANSQTIRLTLGGAASIQ